MQVRMILFLNLFTLMNCTRRIRAGERRLKKLREKNFRMTEISNKLLATNEVIKHDLKMAANMQRSLLPIASSTIQGITIEWLLRSSTDMSGDIFNFFRLDEHHVGFYILRRSRTRHCVSHAVFCT